MNSDNREQNGEKSRPPMPILIKLLILLVIAGLIFYFLSAAYDPHYGVSLSNSWVSTFSLIWFAVVIWIVSDICRRKGPVKITIFLVTGITIVFWFLSFIDSETIGFSVFSFQTLEFLMWIGATLLCLTAQSKIWFKTA